MSGEFAKSRLNHYIESLVVALNMWVVIVAPMVSLILCWLMFRYIFWCWLLYAGWYVYDFGSPWRGSRSITTMRRCAMHKYFVNYFPISLRKTADLDYSRNYLIVSHPHGILSTGAIGNFMTDATSFSKLYPGITTHICTLDANFILPFRREYLEMMGFISCSKKSIEYVIGGAAGTGKAAILVVGGACEALESRPGVHRVILKRRRGFIRLAMKCGAAIVPAYSFGEVDVFNQIDNAKGSVLRFIQENFLKWFTFTTPMFYGCSMSGTGFGFMPYRRPICTVIGSPMEVIKNEHPSEKDVDDVHLRYVRHLSCLFDAHKESFGLANNVQLEII